MKTVVELNTTDLEVIVENYCNKKLAHDNRHLIEIKFDMVPSEERGKREIKCMAIYDYDVSESESNLIEENNSNVCELTNISECLKGNHLWQCIGLDTGGMKYRCSRCEASKYDPKTTI